MIITVQAVPKRMLYIKNQLRKYKNEVNIYFNIDEHYTGSFNSFKNMLNIPVDNYRLHLQDDIILADNLLFNLDYLSNLMNSNNIDVLSLYANPRKAIKKAFDEGKSLVELKPFLMMQGVVFSKRVIDLMKVEINNSRQTKHDDVFVQDVLRMYKIKAYCHLPSLVQHNLELDSIMQHAKNTKNRTTRLFDKDFFYENI